MVNLLRPSGNDAPCKKSPRLTFFGFDVDRNISKRQLRL